MGVIVIGFAADARAQRLEVELGGGYVFGGGVENPGPNLPTFDAGFVVWPAARWGVAVRLVDGPGEDLHEPIVSSDRTFLGQGRLRYWTLTARRRSVLTPTLGMEFGFGLLFSGRYATIQMFHNPPRRSAVADTFFGGVAVEAFLTRLLLKHVGVKAGLTFDFNPETTNLQPMAAGVIRF